MFNVIRIASSSSARRNWDSIADTMFITAFGEETPYPLNSENEKQGSNYNLHLYLSDGVLDMSTP